MVRKKTLLKLTGDDPGNIEVYLSKDLTANQMYDLILKIFLTLSNLPGQENKLSPYQYIEIMKGRVKWIKGQ